MTPPPRDLLEQGHYARKQIFSRNAIVAWSHGRRFAVARELAAARAGGALLDYGCGDGTFVVLAHDAFRETVGADIDTRQVQGCVERLGSLADVQFVTIDALREPRHRERYDAVVCMEVLEHCPADVQPAVLDDLARLAKPDAVVVISVPIEIGPTLIVKQAVRAMAAVSGLTEYAHRERYRPAELLRMVLAADASPIPRQEIVATTPEGATVRFHGHKGFNWHTLERLVTGRFIVERRFYSPVRLTGPWLNSQVWFMCRKR